MNPVPTLLNATPSSLNIGSSTVVLTGANFINGATVLENGAPIPTQFNSSGQLTATVDPTVAGPFDLQVLNPNPGGAVSADVIEQVAGTPPTPLVQPADASRFLMQATFGGSEADINNLSTIGYNAWFAQQFAIPNTLHEPYAEREIMLNTQPPCAATDSTCNQKLFLQTFGDQYFEQPFWSSALTGKDELRKRVQFALSELFVISSQDAVLGQMPRGVANYYDMLGNDAFGNFRQLLNDVTLSPMMGIYLSTLANDKGDATRDPDENYAREVMQLFTIGLWKLNPDGTQQLDGSGNPIPTYSNTDVMGIAKVFTGFSWNMGGNTSDQAWSGYGAVYAGPGFGQDLLPMTTYPTHHSTDEKDFLGMTIPAGSSDPSADLKIALDALFNHPNIPPFVSKQLIQQLVTSNPSPAYVQRVAAVFQDDGQGVRGDMQAVITAILMDEEARNSDLEQRPQLRQGAGADASLYPHGARIYRGVAKRRLRYRQYRGSGLRLWGDGLTLAHHLQLVRSRLCTRRHHHRDGWADRAGDGDHRCDHGDRLSQQHASRRVFRLRQQRRPLYDADYGDRSGQQPGCTARSRESAAAGRPDVLHPAQPD